MSALSDNLQKARPGDKSLYGATRTWLLKANAPAGLQQWVDFHNSPISQMHPTRWANVEPDWQAALRGSFYARAYLDEYFRDHWNWESGTWTDLKNPLMQLAICSYSSLAQLATFAGALVAAEEIRKAVDGKTVRLLRNSLGDDVFQFACLQAPHINVAIPKMCQIRQWDAAHAADIVLDAGWLLIACASALLTTEEWRQFLRRLPQKTEEMWNQCNFSEEDFQMAWQCLQALFDIMTRKNEHA